MLMLPHAHPHARSCTYAYAHAHTLTCTLSHTDEHIHTHMFIRDHYKLFVGDARGSVFSWTVSDNLGELTNSLPIFLIHLVYS